MNQKTELTELEALVLKYLRGSCEGFRDTKADGSVWADVYLDNVYAAAWRCNGVSTASVKGALASLTTKGVYQSTREKWFGSVKL